MVYFHRGGHCPTIFDVRKSTAILGLSYTSQLPGLESRLHRSDEQLCSFLPIFPLCGLYYQV